MRACVRPAIDICTENLEADKTKIFELPLIVCCTDTTRVPCFIVGGGDTGLCRHPDYDHQQQQQQYGDGEGAELSKLATSETYAAYVTADLAFHQSSSSLQQFGVSVHDSETTCTVYTVDQEATARLQDAVRRLNTEQQFNNKPRPTTSKTSLPASTTVPLRRFVHIAWCLVVRRLLVFSCVCH